MTTRAPVYVCRQCARAAQRSAGSSASVLPGVLRQPPRRYSTASASEVAPENPSSADDQDGVAGPDSGVDSISNTGANTGAMSRRLQEATEEALLTGGRAGRRAIEEAGFSEELKTRLLGRIADAQFQAEHGRTIAASGLDPVSLSPQPGGSLGQGSLSVAQPWTGEEATTDVVRRMLEDAHKPLSPQLRRKSKSVPDSVVVDLRLRRSPPPNPGRRAAAAREKATAYAGMTAAEKNKEGMTAKTNTEDEKKGLSASERDALRREFRERFTPGARAMPNTISGLAALANERIEDAMARGQFHNIPRGPGVERDNRADNPFIDTTEYIMNKMIQRQDMVPPWIEKQQEVVRAARAFRSRLRSDWRRHAARSIASSGGSLLHQLARARAYARAEEVHNPRRRETEQMAVPTNVTGDAVMVKRAAGQVADQVADASAGLEVHEIHETADSDSFSEPMTRPFRDPQWEAAERSYMELAIRNMNALTRSYNLMAPELAKKPYFSLDRELRACFADVAPTLAETIRERAAQAAGTSTSASSPRSRRVLDRFVGEDGGRTRVYDSKTPNYGIKEMLRDWWRPAR